MPPYDAILIPGGGVRDKGDFPIWVKSRLDKAIEIQQGEYIITLSAGTFHKKPPLDERGFPIYESVAGAIYLNEHGINPEKILPETCSYDTLGNAYFSRVIHVDPMGFSKLLIITSEFHMPRTEIIFRWIYSLDVPLKNKYDLQFMSVENDGMDEISLRERKIAERENISRLFTIKDKIQTMKQFHEWLYTEHDAYAVSMVHSPESRATGKILDTY